MVDLEQWWSERSGSERQRLLMLRTGDEVPVELLPALARALQAVGTQLGSDPAYTFHVQSSLGNFLDGKRNERVGNQD